MNEKRSLVNRARVLAHAATISLAGVLMLHPAVAVADPEAQVRPTATKVAEPMTGTCSSPLTAKPAAPTLLRSGRTLTVLLPAATRGCDRMVRIVDERDALLQVVPASAGRRTLVLTVPATVTVSAQVKVVDAEAEGLWSEPSAPAGAAAPAQVRALRVTAQRGGVLVGWRAADCAGVEPEQYRVTVERAGERVLQAALATRIRQIWVPAPTTGRYRVSVRAVDRSGRSSIVTLLRVLQPARA